MQYLKEIWSNLYRDIKEIWKTIWWFILHLKDFIKRFRGNNLKMLSWGSQGMTRIIWLKNWLENFSDYGRKSAWIRSVNLGEANRSLYDFLSIGSYQEKLSNHSIHLDFFRTHWRNFKEVLWISVQGVLQVLRISETSLRSSLDTHEHSSRNSLSNHSDVF